MSLSLKQARFIKAYLGSSRGNATDAARRAGYRSPEVSGFKLLRTAKISSAIQEHLSRGGSNPDAIVARLCEFAFADVGEFLPEKPQHGRTFLLRRLRTKAGLILEINDPVKALELLGKYHGLWNRHDRRLQRDALELARQRLEGPDSGRDFRDLVTAAEERALERRRERAERNGDGQADPAEGEGY
jgi:hypothetical protein